MRTISTCSSHSSIGSAKQYAFTQNYMNKTIMSGALPSTSGYTAEIVIHVIFLIIFIFLWAYAIMRGSFNKKFFFWGSIKEGEAV
jgi:hypothetical protein